MLSKSTIEILRKLNSHELKRLGDFISSPYHNTTASFQILYQIILKSYPDFSNESLKFEEISKVIFPDGENKLKRTKNLCAEFGNILKKFIGYETLHKINYELDLHIADGLSKKDLFNISEKFIRKSIAKNDKGLVTDSVKLFYNQRINVLQRNNISQRVNHSEDEYEQTITIISEAIITGFIRNTYTEAYSNAVRDAVSSKRKVILFEAFLESFDMNNFLKILKQTNNKHYSYLKINYMLYYHIKFDINEEQFYDLKNEIFNIIDKMDKWEAYTFIYRTIALVLVKLIPKDKKYYNDLFELGKLFCSLKVFSINSEEVFSIGNFRDTFLSAVILKEYDWAESFAIEYSYYLSEEFRENELNYCLGILNFKRGDFKNSLTYFSKVKPVHTIQKINLRFYYLLNYIELKAYENALSALQVIRQFYNDRKDIPEIFYRNIPDSLKYFQEIIRCEVEGEKVSGLLYNEALNSTNYYHRQYILEKIQTLM